MRNDRLPAGCLIPGGKICINGGKLLFRGGKSLFKFSGKGRPRRFVIVFQQTMRLLAERFLPGNGSWLAAPDTRT